MKILLTFTEINQKFGALYYQHGLASISSVLKKNGFHDIALSHFIQEPNYDHWQEHIKNVKPDIIGFYSTAEQFQFVGSLIEKVPEGIFTVCGGPHPTCYPDCIEVFPRLDAICIGEGEYPMLELVKGMHEGKDYSGIKNLWIRKGGQIIKNDVRAFISDLNELPFADRDLFNLQDAIDKYGLGQVRVMTTRGCPYQCTYCSNRRISEAQEGRYVRFRSAEHIMEELNQLNGKYQFEEIFFDDDIFMMNKNIRKEFCRRYPDEIGKAFVFCGRVEQCNHDLLADLKAAGGRRIDFGIESGNEELRRTILKRNMTNEQILNSTQMAKSVGLQVKTLNMVGLPEESLEKHMDTVRLNQEIKPDIASIYTFYPYPGTELYDYCVEKQYYKPVKFLPKGYVSRRDTMLDMPGFSRKDIQQSLKWFGFRVFRKYSLVKAVGFTIMNSGYGELFLGLTKRFRKMLRNVFKGF
jgi:anaerobic magnesium-protoporphyrin IX monomethyl ester cyclase